MDVELWLEADSPACSLRPGQLSRLEKAGLLADVLAVCQDACGRAEQCGLFRRVSRRAARRAQYRAVREIARVCEI